MSNFIPYKIINLQGEIYQLVQRENENPVYQGSFESCSQHLKDIISKEFLAVLKEAILPN